VIDELLMLKCLQCFLAAALTIVSVATTSTYMIIQNRKQAQGRTVIEGVEGFRYTLLARKNI
jgi:hypothetical protein